MRLGGGSRRTRPPTLPPLDGVGSSLPPVDDGGRSDRSVPLPEELNLSPRLGSLSVSTLTSPREELPPLSHRRRGSREMLTARDRPQLEPLGIEMPQLDLQVEVPAIASRSTASFTRRRIAPTGVVGTRLAPLVQGSSSSNPLDREIPIPSLRPACPWDKPPTISDGRLRNEGEGDCETLAPLVLNVEETIGRSDSANSQCEVSARAEVEKAVHTAFLEECGRGSSPTAAAVEAIRRCRSSVSRESKQERSPVSNESHRLLLKDGDDLTMVAT